MAPTKNSQQIERPVKSGGLDLSNVKAEGEIASSLTPTPFDVLGAAHRQETSLTFCKNRSANPAWKENSMANTRIVLHGTGAAAPRCVTPAPEQSSWVGPSVVHIALMIAISLSSLADELSIWALRRSQSSA